MIDLKELLGILFICLIVSILIVYVIHLYEKFKNKLMYYFGYAPIELKTEYKTVVFNKELDFEVIKSVKRFENKDHKQFYKNEIKSEILSEVERKIEWFVYENEFGNFIEVEARLYIGKHKNK